MKTASLICLNTIGPPAVHLFWATVADCLPRRWFMRSAAPTDESPRSDTEVHFYRRWLQVRFWKGRLPDGGAWFGRGFAKSRLVRLDPGYLTTYVAETRRGELAHWAMLVCTPVFFLWNPPWACAVLTLYGFAANLPCIVVQRYNRAVIQARLRRSVSIPSAHRE